MSQKRLPSGGNSREGRGNVRGMMPDAEPNQGTGLVGEGRSQQTFFSWEMNHFRQILSYGQWSRRGDTR